MNVSDLRNKSVGELNALVLDLLREQFEYRMKLATGQLTQTNVIKNTRRNIARVKTVIASKKLGD